MAVVGTLMYQNDDPNLAAGTVRGWKIGFGYTAKGSVVSVYVVGEPTHVSEIPKLANGKADVTAISNYLAGYGVSLTAALRNVIGA